LPAGARVLAQGYLNRFSMPMLGDWLLPKWMREQSDPACDWFVPRSVTNVMVNQTRRNWTALGIPGAGHPVESIVDRWGLLTPIPGGPSLDWWVRVDGVDGGWMAASEQQEVLQSLQGRLPVAVTSYEANGLRVSSEAWMLPLLDADWAAMQVVLFNIADVPLKGSFCFALRPYNPEGISPIYDISFDGTILLTDDLPGPYVWPQPERCSLSSLSDGDLFRRPTTDHGRPTTKDEGRKTKDDWGEATGLTTDIGERSSVVGRRSSVPVPSSISDPRGFAHATLEYSFEIEPWEEAEFLAFTPVHWHYPTRFRSARRLFMPVGGPGVSAAVRSVGGGALQPGPQFYSHAKGATTLQWRSLLDNGMRVELPDRDLQASWEANQAHVLALHDGDIITPGPDLYHNFWFRDAAYMANALSASGYREAGTQLLRGFMRRQRRDGAFVSQLGEWDSTGQALWFAGQHLALHPDPDLLVEVSPAVERGARWILSTLARSPDGLMPPGISSEHFGPSDRYYWDSIWSLAGLRAAYELLEGHYSSAGRYRQGAVRLRRTLARAWAADIASLGRQALVAAPGRDIDLGMIGTLVSWFPLRLMPSDSPLLEGTLSALEEALFYEGALFVNTGHSGWGTYLNMRLAGCRLLQGSPKGWEAMLWLLRHASPTYNWPEAIHTRSLGGSAGDGQHGWASAEWLLLVRALLFQEERRRLVLTPALPADWLTSAGYLSVENAPTRFGPISYHLEWDGDRHLHLQLTPRWRSTPPEVVWRAPGAAASAQVDGSPASPSAGGLVLPAGARNADISLE
jgi:hypothetical protein